VRPIDVRYQGVEHAVCCWQVEDVLVDPGPESTIVTLLEALGKERPRALALTHIHFDHAGAAGALVRRWPDLEVWVHERGAKHLVDPTRLIASAKRLFGEDLDRLFGEFVPVPKHAIKILRGGERIGEFDVAVTPGHAHHHLTYFHRDSGWVFPGDTCGVRLPTGNLVLPNTPPPDIDLAAWRDSLDTIAAWEPAMLALTHFGAYSDVAAHLAVARAGLERWGDYARAVDSKRYAAALRAAARAAMNNEDARAFELTMPLETWWLGFDHYWSTLREHSAL
jgi:glyoxylase-like metal-dependent hydrolase (beta-lactamase superfamily II)